MGFLEFSLQFHVSCTKNKLLRFDFELSLFVHAHAQGYVCGACVSLDKQGKITLHIVNHEDLIRLGYTLASIRLIIPPAINPL